MSNIWGILHKPDTVVFFDIDGTLTSYNYGQHHAHHELDGTPESVVLMDDNDDTLGMYMAQTPFCTAHPMIFMEYL